MRCVFAAKICSLGVTWIIHFIIASPRPNEYICDGVSSCDPIQDMIINGLDAPNPSLDFAHRYYGAPAQPMSFDPDSYPTGHNKGSARAREFSSQTSAAVQDLSNLSASQPSIVPTDVQFQHNLDSIGEHAITDVSPIAQDVSSYKPFAHSWFSSLHAPHVSQQKHTYQTHNEVVEPRLRSYSEYLASASWEDSTGALEPAVSYARSLLTHTITRDGKVRIRHKHGKNLIDKLLAEILWTLKEGPSPPGGRMDRNSQFVIIGIPARYVPPIGQASRGIIRLMDKGAGNVLPAELVCRRMKYLFSWIWIQQHEEHQALMNIQDSEAAQERLFKWLRTMIVEPGQSSLPVVGMTDVLQEWNVSQFGQNQLLVIRCLTQKNREKVFETARNILLAWHRVSAK